MPLTRSEKIDLGVAVGSITAFLLGWRRLAGGIVLTNGVYNLTQRRPVAGGAGVAVGSAFLLWPDWPGSLGRAIEGKSAEKLPASPPTPAPIVVELPANYQRAAYLTLDRMLDGGWTMLDVRDLRGASVATRAPRLQPGNEIGLVLRTPQSNQHLVFSARVTGGSAETMYQGVWTTQPPEGGPAKPEFGQEHVYVVR